MLLNPVSAATLRTATAASAGLLTPLLAPLTESSAQTQTLRAQSERDERGRQRRSDDERARDAVAGGESPAAVALQAERQLRPSSHAFQRQEARALAQQDFARGQSAFRSALTDAAGREPPVAVAPPTTNASTKNASQPNPPAVDAGAATPPKAGVPSAAMHSEQPRTTSVERIPPAAPASTASVPVTPPPVSATSAPNAARAAAESNVFEPAAPSAGANAPQTKAVATESPPATATAAASASAEPRGGAASGPTSGLGILREGFVKTATAGNGTRPAASTAPSTGKDDANFEQIVRVIQSRIGKERAVATLRLDPPDLGTIKLHMDLRHQNLELLVDSTTGAAHRLLSEQVETLRQALDSAGIRLERIEFRPPGEPPHGFDADTGQQSAPQPRDDGGSANANAERSRGQGTESEHYATDAAGTVDASNTREPDRRVEWSATLNVLA